MAKIKVFYMKPNWFRDGICGKKPDPANLTATHVELMAFDSDSDAVLGQIYHNMQGEIWSPNGEACDLIESKGLEHTSMSVGDVIVVDGDVHVVASFGFENLGKEGRGA